MFEIGVGGARGIRGGGIATPAPPLATALCSSKNGAYRDSNLELFISSQALCRLVHSRPGHLLYVAQCIYFCIALTL